MTVYIHAPQAVGRLAVRNYCPTCERRTVKLAWLYEYYGALATCLRCGERWSGGEMMPRPFCPGWRKENIKSARKRWRALPAEPQNTKGECDG